MPRTVQLLREWAGLTWSYRFGLLRTFDYEGGNKELLKGVVLDGEVYGDTAVYTPPPPSEVQKDYFPYKAGDILIYTVTGSLGTQLLDSKITLMQDSVDAAGSVWYSVEAKGADPFIHQFIVDTSRNVYGTGWWEDNHEPWMIYDAYNVQSVPWVAIKKQNLFELGMLLGIEVRFVHGRNFGINIIYDVFTINYYLAEDSATQGFDTYEGEFRTYAEWTKEFGIFHKYEYDTGLTYELKGGIINGVALGDTAAEITSNEPVTGIPSNIRLYQNYPNPFNPSTVIRFELSHPTSVSLKIYDTLGNLVQALVSERAHTAGQHQYTWNAASFSSGVYFYRLITNHKVITKKMILIK